MKAVVEEMLRMPMSGFITTILLIRLAHLIKLMDMTTELVAVL
jgi:hypothetical protein